MITKRGRRLQRYDLQLIMCGDIVKDFNSYLKSRGSIEDFVSFREMITSQLQGKLWLYDEVQPVEILEKEFKKLKRSRISIVKVRWNSKCGPEFKWEREDQMKLKYPHSLVMLVAEFQGTLGARDAARNLEPLMGDRGRQKEVNGNRGNRNGNGNRNEGGNGYNFRGYVPDRECTYQDFLKCHPLSFNVTEGVVGLTRWFKKMETVFHISNCPEKYQVKYAMCTLLKNALNWWNSHKRTIRIEATYATSWAVLALKYGDLSGITFIIYSPVGGKFVSLKKCLVWFVKYYANMRRTVVDFSHAPLNEYSPSPNDKKQCKDNEDPSWNTSFKMRKLQKTTTAVEALWKTILHCYLYLLGTFPVRSAESKRRLDNNPRDNRGQQPAFKRQNISGPNVARAYTAGNNEKKRKVGSLPYCNKCKLHHAGPCTVRCGNCKRVGHITRDFTAIITPNTQRAPTGNQSGIVCYECGRPRHFRKDCPKLRNQNRGNKTGNKNGNKTENQTRGNEATARAYAIGGGGANPESNVVTGMFLLNNCYASMLFDSGADRSFVSSTFSDLLDVAPSTLDTSQAVELADRRISEMNVVLRGCTLGLLGHSFDINLMLVELGSFDVIIGMDWLAKSHSLIVCDEKVILQVTSKKTKDKSKEKWLEDVLIVQEYPKVFPEDLPGLPPTRQVEFQIDLVLGAAPVVRAPYRLTTTKMQELSTQLLDAVGVTAALMDVNAAQLKLLLTVEVKTAKVRVTAAKQKLVLFTNFNEKYAK
ncbi:putative reverse transcriptase domain-containing protein [Tanacetum coccineum]